MNRNFLEWGVLAISVVALVGLVGFLLVDALTSGDDPPSISIELRTAELRETPVGWTAPATVRNEGDQGAEAVVVVASAVVGGETVESEVTIDLLPADSETEVAFGFPGRPEGPIEVRLVGFRSA